MCWDSNHTNIESTEPVTAASCRLKSVELFRDLHAFKHNYGEAIAGVNPGLLVTLEELVEAADGLDDDLMDLMAQSPTEG